MKIKSLVTVGASLLLATSAYASNCDHTKILAKNTTLSNLELKTYKGLNKSKLSKKSSGSSLRAGQTFEFSAESGRGTGGAAEGHIDFTARRGETITLTYKVEPRGKLGKGECKVTTALGNVANGDNRSPKVVVDSSNGKPPTINFYINRSANH